MLDADEECGDSHVWYKYFPVETRDVLSSAPVSPGSFSVESTRVLILVSTVWTVSVCPSQQGAVQLLLLFSAACIVQELFSTSGACCFPVSL